MVRWSSRLRTALGTWQPMLTAVLALILTVLVFVMVYRGAAAPGADELRNRAAAALQDRHFREAVLLARHALQKAPYQMEARMQLVEAYAGMGNLEGQVEQLNQLAPLDYVVYGPAHLYRARMIVASGGRSAGALATAQRSLDLALRAKPEHGQGTVDPDAARALQAEIEAAGGAWEKALASASEVATPAPGTLLLIAKALQVLGHPLQAAVAADAAVVELDRAVTGATLEDRLLRLSIRTNAWMLKGEIGKAVAGVRAETNQAAEPQMRALQADFFGRAARICREGPNKDSRLWLEAVAGGLALVPNDLGLTTELLAGVSVWLYQPGFAECAAGRLDADQLPGLRELVVGLENLQEGNVGGAFQHFESGYALLPDNPIVANNLAAILGTRPLDSDPARALTIIDGVVDKFPNCAQFLDTKGQILMRMGRNADALPPLEAALKAQPSPGAHLILAEAYSRLGQSDTAEIHRRAAVPR